MDEVAAPVDIIARGPTK
jgi:hypothetical protein